MPPAASHLGTLVTMGVVPLLVLKTAADSCCMHGTAHWKAALLGGSNGGTRVSVCLLTESKRRGLGRSTIQDGDFLSRVTWLEEGRTHVT